MYTSASSSDTQDIRVCFHLVREGGDHTHCWPACTGWPDLPISNMNCNFLSFVKC